MRYFINLAYNGAKYRGWQRQLKFPSVQQTIEENLGKMVGRPIVINGCGRTDAGVHASQYFAHADLQEFPDYDPLIRINRMLPFDISIFELIPMHHNAHVQYDATVRSYEYYFHTEKNASLAHTSTWHQTDGLNILKLSKAIQLLERYKDFRAFCKKPDLYNDTICKVSAVSLHYNEGMHLYRFSISSNRFLRAMIRLLMGKLLEVANGKMSVDQFEEHLYSGTPLKYMVQVPPQGLYLSKVVYPYIERPAIKQPLHMNSGDWEEIRL